MQLASRFGHVNQIRRERPLTREELMYHVPSIFGEDRHTSRSERYAYIPTITVYLKHHPKMSFEILRQVTFTHKPASGVP